MSGWLLGALIVLAWLALVVGVCLFFAGATWRREQDEEAMSDRNRPSSDFVPVAEIPLPIRALGPELVAALPQARTGYSFEPRTRTLTLHGGPVDGQQFRPDATGTFVRVAEG